MSDLKFKQALVSRLLPQGAPSLSVKVVEIRTGAGPAVLWLSARQLCYLGSHAPESGEIMVFCLADCLKADEEDRKCDHATLVAAKESGVEVDSVKGDLAETENPFSDDQASSEWEERQNTNSGADRC